MSYKRQSVLRALTRRGVVILREGRDLDELAYMVPDAIELLTDESNFAIQLVVPPTVKMAAARPRPTAKKRRRAAA